MVSIGFVNFGVTNYYLQILFLFLMFCLRHEKRRYWLLRLLIPTTAGLTFFFLFPRITPVDWWNGSYLLIFFINMLVMKLTFKVGFRQIVIYGIAAMTLQNLCAKIVTIFFILISSFYPERSALQLIINDILFIFACLILYRLFIRRKQESGGIKIDNVRFSILFSVTLATFFLSFFCDMIMTDNRQRIFCMCMFIIIDLLVLCAEFGVFEKNDLEKENETVERMIYLQSNQRKLFENSIDLINRKCHDIRHELAMLRSDSLEHTGYIKELERDLAGYELNVKTGNEALDVVLTEYGLLCKKEEIRFTYMPDGSALSFMEIPDLYSFFGNALENAVDSLRKVPDKEKRLLTVRIEQKQGVTLINIENYFDGKLKMDKNLPKTTKEDNGFHGFGLKSIKFITEKYDGDLRISQRDEKFILQAIFPKR